MNWIKNNSELSRADIKFSMKNASQNWKRRNSTLSSIVDDFENQIGLSLTNIDKIHQVLTNITNTTKNKSNITPEKETVTNIKKQDKGRSQVFNFEGRKDDILEYIKCVLEGNPSQRLGLGNGPIYGLITNQVSTTHKEIDDMLKDLGYKKTSREVQDSWYSFCRQGFFQSYYQDGKYYQVTKPETGSGWVQKNINPLYKRKNDKKTFNYYVTISRERSNVNKFIDDLMSVDLNFHLRISKSF